MAFTDDDNKGTGGWRRLEAPRGAWDQVDNKVNEEHRIGKVSK